MKTVQNGSKQICCGFVCERTTGNGLFHWRKCYFKLWNLARRNSLKLKASAKMCFLQTQFSLHKTLIDGLELFGLLVDYCDVFISCLDSHSDGTHSLQRIHRWASDVMLNLSKTFLIKKQTHLHLEWPEDKYIFISGWTTPLKMLNEHNYCTVC